MVLEWQIKDQETIKETVTTEMKLIDPTKKLLKPKIPTFDNSEINIKGTKDVLMELGPQKFSEWLMKENKVQISNAAMRNEHQNLLTTDMPIIDILELVEDFAKKHPQIFSIEVWGGATFDVCLWLLQEKPWERLQLLRKAIPNILLQMSIRGTNGIGYSAYPDNLIDNILEQSWENGVDIFRIFDSLNWMKSIAASIEYVRTKTNCLVEGSICYTGDILNPNKTKYSLKYYVQLAKDIENAGAHILGLKDLAGLLKPREAYELILALKTEINIPIHFLHDSSSVQTAMYLKAAEAGVDVIDVAL